LGIFLGLALLLFLTSEYWLAGLGRMMINAEPPVKADVIVVLAGDWRGGRVTYGGKLVREGYAAKALISGTRSYYDTDEAEFAIRFAEKRGYPRSYFEPLNTYAQSTETESRFIFDELKRRGVKKVLIVTSDYHTRRASRILGNAAGDIEVHVTAAPDILFKPDSWWKSREGRKTWLLEFTKLITSPFGI
jgi:uncharacterized SAM-binding protein YcdF (DUF218 family)